MTSMEALKELKDMTKDDKNPRVGLLLDLIHHEMAGKNLVAALVSGNEEAITRVDELVKEAHSKLNDSDSGNKDNGTDMAGKDDLARLVELSKELGGGAVAAMLQASCQDGEITEKKWSVLDLDRHADGQSEESLQAAIENAKAYPERLKAAAEERQKKREANPGGEEKFFIDQMQGRCAELKMFSMACRQLYHELNGNSSTDYRTGPNDEQWVQDRLEPAIDAMAFRLDELSKTFEQFVSFSFDHM